VFFLAEQSSIFALDIGTRSVVGIILKEHENGYEIIDIEFKEHGNRAMLDGQIHDVLSVSKLVKEIKEILETKHGIRFVLLQPAVPLKQNEQKSASESLVNPSLIDRISCTLN